MITAAPARATSGQRSVWHTFLLFFGIMYVGAILDIVTTAIGYRIAGAAYEQNPLGSGLIGHLGWAGLFALLTALAVVAFLTFRAACFQYRPRVTIWIPIILGLGAIVRWLAVVTAVLYIIQH